MIHYLSKQAIVIVILTLLAVTALAQRPEPQKSLVMGDTLYTLLKPNDIPAIFDPEFISIDEAKATYYDNEPLIVVADGSEAKAYSIWHLDQHEVVNDYINGTAITVTW